MTNKAKEIIYSYFKKEGTLVFPTETTARYWISEYAREEKKSLRFDKVISFDNFYDLFLNISGQLIKSDSWSRLLFVNMFLQENKNSLKYYYNKNFPESSERLEVYLVSILQDLYCLKNIDKIKIKELKDDILLIQEKYKKFLKDNNYYEPLFEKPSVDNLKAEIKKPFYIISSDTDSSFKEFYDEIGRPDWIEEVSLYQESGVKLNRYSNEKLELNDVFARISNLAKEGVNGEDIIISTPDLKRLKPYIESRAYKYDIPLSFIGGDNVLETVPGLFLKQVQNVYSNGFSFSSLSALLRNQSLPFKNDEGYRLLQEMVSKNIFLGTKTSSNVDSEEVNRLNPSLLNYYKKLYYIIKAINTDNGIAKLRMSIHSLIVFLFGEDGFTKDEKNKNIFSHILNLLSKAERAEDRVNTKLVSPFSSFISALEKENYVDQVKNEGIKVYSYDQDALLSPKYHFVFGLSEVTCKKVMGRKSFLEDMEVEEGENEKEDITKLVLNLYQTLSENVYLSTSFTTYAGAILPPSYFIENDLIINAERIKDAYAIENDELDGIRTNYKPLRIQKESFNKASATALKRIKKEEDIRRDESRFNLNKDEISLSYSKVDDYTKCPFKYLIKRAFYVDEETTSPEISNDLVIGNILHETVEKFFKLHNEMNKENIDFYKEEIVRIFYSHLESLEGKKDEPSSLSLFAIKEEYPKKLETFIENHINNFPESIVLESETDFSKDFEKGFKLKGIIDHVIKDKNGNIIIIDFKKGATDKHKNSLQLIFYKMIYDTEEKVVSSLYYYGFKDNKFLNIPFTEEKIDEAKKTLEEVANGIKEGIFKTKPSYDNCQECDTRGICRRRFNVQ